MANTNVDLTEEDAADLQFPKESQLTTYQKPSRVINVSDKNIILGYCSSCMNELVSRYILCDKCNVHICLNCFSNGTEFGSHKNNHDYRVLSTNFVLFDNSDWTAEEELRLLESMQFYGNWNLVGLDFPNRTVDELKEHYDYFYLSRHGHTSIPVYREDFTLPHITVPYRFNLTESEEPPRYSPNSIGYQSLAGYNPARGEFENEYDSNAEDLVASLETIDLDDPQYDVLVDLQCSIVENYNNRLRERERRKTVIAQHGLLVLRKVYSGMHRYDTTLSKPVCDKLLRFMQLCEPTKFDMLMEGMHRVGELKIQTQRLINLRRKGITTLAEAKLYLKLQRTHEDNRRQIKVFKAKPNYNWSLNKTAASDVPKIFKRRSTAAPLDIIGLPGYEKLSEKERDMCSNVRLVPATYLELREILIAENNRAGCVKLQKARVLLKIDVNKTRKLYDFMVSEGYIKN